MKKTLFAITAAMVLSVTVSAQTNDSVIKPFLNIEQLPNETYYLPAPPSEGDILFAGDALRYQWGKSLRDSIRGKQAVADANSTLQYMFEYFAPSFGLLISEKETPEIWKLVTSTIADGGYCIRRGKNKYLRRRPYVYFNDPTPVPEKEEKSRNTGSYPSGHTSCGWICALMLVELNPANQDEILKAGYEYGESRVIVGFHYQSDVDAARVAASAAFARLHADEAFLKQLKKAKKELSKILSDKR